MPIHYGPLRLRSEGTTYFFEAEPEAEGPPHSRRLELAVNRDTIRFRDTDPFRHLVLREVSVPVELLFTIYPLMADAIREGQKERGGSWRKLWTRLWTS